jgi:hypothetical protein
MGLSRWLKLETSQLHLCWNVKTKLGIRKKNIILQLLYAIDFELLVTHVIIKPHSCTRQVAHDQ